MEMIPFTLDVGVERPDVEDQELNIIVSDFTEFMFRFAIGKKSEQDIMNFLFDVIYDVTDDILFVYYLLCHEEVINKGQLKFESVQVLQEPEKPIIDKIEMSKNELDQENHEVSFNSEPKTTENCLEVDPNIIEESKNISIINEEVTNNRQLEPTNVQNSQKSDNFMTNETEMSKDEPEQENREITFTSITKYKATKDCSEVDLNATAESENISTNEKMIDTGQLNLETVQILQEPEDTTLGKVKARMSENELEQKDRGIVPTDTQNSQKSKDFMTDETKMSKIEPEQQSYEVALTSITEYKTIKNCSEVDLNINKESENISINEKVINNGQLEFRSVQILQKSEDIIANKIRTKMSESELRQKDHGITPTSIPKHKITTNCLETDSDVTTESNAIPIKIIEERMQDVERIKVKHKIVEPFKAKHKTVENVPADESHSTKTSFPRSYKGRRRRTYHKRKIKADTRIKVKAKDSSLVMNPHRNVLDFRIKPPDFRMVVPKVESLKKDHEAKPPDPEYACRDQRQNDLGSASDRIFFLALH
jgi:hypothetical protein